MDSDDPFASILKFCHPTDSQLAKFAVCPLDRESQDFDTQPSPTVRDSFIPHQQPDDLAVFHTPPEHHFHFNFSSSEDQNPNHLRAQGARTVDLGDGAATSKKVSGFHGDLDGERESKRIRVRGKAFDGEAVPLGRTENVANENRGDEAVADEIIDLDGEGSDEETMASDLAVVSMKEAGFEVGVAGGVWETTGLKKLRASIIDAIDESHGLGSKCDGTVRDIRVDEGKRLHVSSDVSGNLDGGEAEDEVAKVSGNEKTSNDRNGYEGQRTACTRTEDIDEFRFSGRDGAGRNWKSRELGNPTHSKRKRELPSSMKEMENNEGGSIKGKEKHKGRGYVAGKGETKGAGLNMGKENSEGGTSVAGKGQARSGGLNSGKDKNDGGSNVVGKVDMKIVQLNKGMEEEGGMNTMGKVETRSGQLNGGKEKNAGGSNVAGLTETKNGVSNKGKEKIDGGSSVVDMERKAGQSKQGKQKKDYESDVAGKAEVKSGQLNNIKEKSEVGRNMAGKGEMRSGESRNGKEKNEGGVNAAGKVETRSGQVNRGKGKNAGESNVAGMTETENGNLNKGKEKNHGWSNVAGKMARKSDQLNWGKEGTNCGSSMAEMKSGQLYNRKEGRNLMTGKGEKKGGLLEMVDILKIVFQNLDNSGGSDGDVDFLETAKKRGVTFPRPRWWPPEGEEM